MSEANHSPLPWHAPSAGVYTQDGMLVTSCGTHTIVEAWRAKLLGSKAIAEIAEANARHIVRCVNSHADLLAACEAAVDGIAAMRDGLPATLSQIQTLHRKCRAAIAKDTEE